MNIGFDNIINPNSGQKLNINKLTVAYSRPKNLRDILCPTTLIEFDNSTVSSLSTELRKWSLLAMIDDPNMDYIIVATFKIVKTDFQGLILRLTISTLVSDKWEFFILIFLSTPTHLFTPITNKKYSCLAKNYPPHKLYSSTFIF